MATLEAESSPSDITNLEAKSSQQTEPSPEAPADFPPAVLGAARCNSVRKVVLALLQWRPNGITKPDITKALNDLHKAVPSFKLPQAKAAVNEILKEATVFKPPGRYALKHSELYAKELEGLVEIGLEALKEPSKAKRKGALLTTATDMDAEDGKRQATSGDAVDLEELTHDLERTLESEAQEMTSNGSSKNTNAVSTSLDDHADAADVPSPPLHAAEEQHLLAPRPVPSRAAAADADTNPEYNWISEVASHQPQPLPLITTVEEYIRAETAYRCRYEEYFRLHQLLVAHQQDLDYLRHKTLHDNDDSVEAQAKADRKRLIARRAERVKTWRAAFDVLHKQLGAWRKGLKVGTSVLPSVLHQEEIASGVQVMVEDI